MDCTIPLNHQRGFFYVLLIDYIMIVPWKWNLMTIFGRYLLYGDITAKAAHMLAVPKVNCSESKNDVFILLFNAFQLGILLLILFFV